MKQLISKEKISLKIIALNIKRVLSRFQKILMYVISPVLFVYFKAVIFSRKNRAVRHDVVVFVCDHYHSRIGKLASGLKAHGIYIYLLHGFSVPESERGYFDEVSKFSNKWHAIYLAMATGSSVFHVFSSWNFVTASIFIRLKPGKIVFDNYDLLNGMVKPLVLKRYSRQAKLELYCYQYADGVCCRDLRPLFLKKEMKIVLPKTIFFPEYLRSPCDYKNLKKLNGIHLAYVGNFELDPDDPVAYQYDLAVALSKAGIHFHLYPSSQGIADKLKLEMSKRFLNEDVRMLVEVHNTLSPSELKKDLSKYHAGLLISTKRVNYHDDHTAYFKHMENYFLAAKIFDYIETGLFVIAQQGRVVRRVIEPNGFGKTVASLDEVVLACKNIPVTKQPLNTSYLLENNSMRLIEFYSNLINGVR